MALCGHGRSFAVWRHGPTEGDQRLSPRSSSKSLRTSYTWWGGCIETSLLKTTRGVQQCSAGMGANPPQLGWGGRVGDGQRLSSGQRSHVCSAAPSCEMSDRPLGESCSRAASPFQYG